MAIGCCKSSLYDDSLSGVVVAILFLLSLLNITTNFLSVCHMLISTLGTVFENSYKILTFVVMSRRSF